MGNFRPCCWTLAGDGVDSAANNFYILFIFGHNKVYFCMALDGWKFANPAHKYVCPSSHVTFNFYTKCQLQVGVLL